MPGPVQTATTQTALEFRSVTKMFGDFVACDAMTFSISRGQIHGIVGENGAGKSTAMKMLYGSLQPTSGEIYINGKLAKISSPRDSNKLGIGMVFQHFMLSDTHTILEHVVFSCAQIMGLGQIAPLRTNQVAERLNAFTEEFGMSGISLSTRIEQLSLGDRQKVEIIKSLFNDASILILDEPTAVLTPQEADTLMNFIRNYRARGGTVIFISHKLNEVLDLCDSITVIRKGKVVETIIAKSTNASYLAEKMVGRPVQTISNPLETFSSRTSRESVCSIKRLNATSKSGKHCLKDISLELFRYEVVGVAGIDGNGQRELIELFQVFNEFKLSGSMTFNGIALSDIAMIPEDRQRDGLLMRSSIRENVLLGYHDRSLKKNKIQDINKEILKSFGVQPASLEAKAHELSGGNQQKVVVGREVLKCSPLLICAHPTRGVDIGAIERIHQSILDERNRGSCILLISSQLEEIFALSDRIVVMFRGAMSQPQNRSEVDFKKIGLLMTGVGFA